MPGPADYDYEVWVVPGAPPADMQHWPYQDFREGIIAELAKRAAEGWGLFQMGGSPLVLIYRRLKDYRPG